MTVAEEVADSRANPLARQILPRAKLVPSQVAGTGRGTVIVAAFAQAS
ncbi:hypothetical protein [Micromonospora sp. NPDC047074]